MNEEILKNNDITVKTPVKQNTYTPKDLACVIIIYSIAWFYFSFWGSILSYGMYATIFTCIYTVGILAVLRLKNITPTKESKFWFVLLLLTGVSYSLWANEMFVVFKALFLHALAVYTLLSATGALIKTRTSAAFLVDGFFGFTVYPFQNFGKIFAAFFGGIVSLKQKIFKQKQNERKALYTFLGIIIAIPIVIIVISELSKASQAFARLFNVFLPFDFLINKLPQMVLCLIIAMYLFGLVFSTTNAKNIALHRERMLKINTKVIPAQIISIVLISVAAVYVLFFVNQSYTLINVITGGLSGGKMYSVMAREAFFALCRVAVLNLVIISVGGAFGTKEFFGDKFFRTMCIIISTETLILIVIAFSKMAMYIKEFGFTPKRVFTSVFMLFLGVVFVLLLIRCKKNINVATISFRVFCVGYCLLLLINLGGLISYANVKLIQKGIISESGASNVFCEIGQDALPAAKLMLQIPNIDKYSVQQYVSAANQSKSFSNKNGGCLTDNLS